MSGRLPSASGDPHDTDPWEWSCGFYPGSRIQANIGPTPPRRSNKPAPISKRAWHVFLSNRTEADFQAWRDERDWTERKNALWDAGKRLEPPNYGPSKPAHRSENVPAVKRSTRTAPRRC